MRSPPLGSLRFSSSTGSPSEERLLLGLEMARRVVDFYLSRRNSAGVRRMRRLEDRILRDLLAIYARELALSAPEALPTCDDVGPQAAASRS